jgi:hypothetical protein
MSGGISVTTIASYAAIAGTVISAASAIQQGKTQSRAIEEQGRRDAAMGDYQRRQADADASVAASEAQLQARQIRKAGDRQRAEARASLAASGVTLGAGSAEVIDKEIGANAEEDALMSIYQGDVRAGQIRQGGKLADFQGQSSLAASATKSANVKSASYINAGASALSGVGAASRAWGSSSTGGADPVGDFYQRGTRGSGD